MLRRNRQDVRGVTTQRAQGRLARRWQTVLALGCLVVVAGCGAAAHGQATATHTASHTVTHTPTHASGTPTVAASPTVVPTATPAPVQITDLGAFRQKVIDAFGSGNWAQVQPLLSPNLSFEGPLSSSHQLMPYSASYMQQYYGWGKPWSQGSDYELSLHSCYFRDTPGAQQLGFDGNANGAYMLIALQQWQGYWVIGWGFEDPQGGYDGCIFGD